MDRTDQLALPAPQARRSWRNPALGQLADALTAAADVCVHPLVVVPLFIATLTESTVTVGLAVALVLGASALAYPLAAAFGHRALLRFGGLMGAVGLRAFALFSLAGVPVLYRTEPARQLNSGLLLLAGAALLDGVAAPFYILYAVRELGGDGRTASIYLVVLALARAAGIFLWRALGAQGGNRMVLQLCAFVRLLAPITALTLPPLLGSATLRDRLPGGNAISLIAFALVFAAAGAASAGLDLAAPVVQASITTPRERPAASVLTHLALGVAAVAVLLGGLIADRLGFPFLFIVALVAGLGALLAGGLVDEPNLVVLRAPPSERPAPRRRRRVRRDD